MRPTPGKYAAAPIQRKKKSKNVGHVGYLIYLCIVKKEFGKWLMDIAKYIATAVILTSVFGGIKETWVIYVGGMSAISVTLIGGLWLLRDKKKGEK